MIRKYLIISIIILITYSFDNIQAQAFVLEGHVKSMDNSKLIGATIYDEVSGKGTITNDQGYYNIGLQKGKHKIAISYVGYMTHYDLINIAQNMQHDYKLEYSTLNNVIIRGSKHKIHLNSVQKPMELDMETIKTIPSLIGEPDVMKALTLMPGISQTSEASSNLTIRGASHDQNLIILDEAPLYQTGHLFGFVSPFNYNAINDVKVYKNAIPAIYGGKLSSVIELHSNNGNPDSTRWSYLYGTMNAGVSVSTPIIKNKLTFFTAARTFYLGLITLPLYVLYKQEKVRNYFTYYLYDINSNLVYTPNDKDELGIYFYSGIDNIPLYSHPENNDFTKESKSYLKWGNKTISLKYKRKMNNSLFLKNHLTYSKSFNRSFQGYFDSQESDNNHSKLRNSSLENISFKSYFENYKNIHQFKYGIEAGYYFITPFHDKRAGNFKSDIYSKYNYSQLDFFAEDLIEKGKWSLYGGLRYSNYFAKSIYHWQLEPRASLNYHINNQNSIGIGYQHIAQYSFLLPVSNLGLPNDLWASLLDKMKPSLIDQIFFEYNTDIFDKRINIETDIFFRKYSDLFEIKNKTSFLFTSPLNWQKKILKDGVGYAYGIELQAGFNFKKNKAIVSYSYSRNKYHFDDLNKGKYYPGYYDFPHQLDINITGKISRRWTYSALFKFKSGKPVTLPAEIMSYSPVGIILVYGDKNGARLGAYHRLDVSVSKTWMSKKGKTKTLTFALFNSYYHKNPFYFEYIFSESTFNPKTKRYENKYIDPRLEEISLLPIIPSISYSVKF